MVTAADTSDRTAAHVLLEQVADAHHRLALVWADGGYTGSLVGHCLTALALVLAVVKRSDNMRGFVVLPKRWIVERFFAHLMRTRRFVPVIAQLVQADEDTVRDVIHRFNEIGPACLDPQ